jgi:hypothetical protein
VCQVGADSASLESSNTHRGENRMLLQPLVPVVRGKHTRTAESPGTLRRYGADERIYRQDEPAEYWFRRLGGAARRCTQISDGRRQIVDLAPAMSTMVSVTGTSKTQIGQKQYSIGPYSLRESCPSQSGYTECKLLRGSAQPIHRGLAGCRREIAAGSCSSRRFVTSSRPPGRARFVGLVGAWARKEQ